MVAVVVFGFSGMRCQPLRRALGLVQRIVNEQGIWSYFFSIGCVILFFSECCR
nr:acetyltransferase [Vibrio cidicii]